MNDEIIKELRKTHHLYILKSWRINVVWLNEFNIEKVVDTLYEVTKGKRLE
jgi:aspartate/tyrosine/aromatic aminotransferase